MQVSTGPFSSLPQDYGKQLQDNSLLNSPGFLSVWETMGGRPKYWTVSNSENQIILIAGSVEFKKPMMRSLQLLVDGLYFNPLIQEFPSDLIKHALENLWSTISSSGYQRVHLNDLDGHLSELEPTDIIECETLIADIDSSDWMPPDKKLQSEIGKAKREKINVQKFDRKLHLDRFITLMEQTEARHNRKPKYSAKFFDTLARLSESENRIDWTWVEVNSQPSASHINLLEGDMLINWQVYYDKQFSWLKPNQYLLTDAIHRGWSQGVRRVNFGATPDSADGVRAYKEKWGGKPRKYQTLVYRKGLGWIR